MVNSEPGTVPFAISFDEFGNLVIAEAGTNALATFALSGHGTLSLLDAVGTGQAATCWVAPAGSFLFASNAGSAADPPEHWIEVAEGRMEAGKLAFRIRAWIDELPARQRAVVLLRDVEGMSSEEVCTVLALSEGNQRVLLHRGRSRLRQLFEDEFREVR